jgi:hypothetical protein
VQLGSDPARAFSLVAAVVSVSDINLSAQPVTGICADRPFDRSVTRKRPTVIRWKPLDERPNLLLWPVSNRFNRGLWGKIPSAAVKPAGCDPQADGATYSVCLASVQRAEAPLKLGI